MGGWLAGEYAEPIAKLNSRQWVCKLVRPIKGLVQPAALRLDLPSDHIVVYIEHFDGDLPS
jgi:hypothetical protein